MADIKEVLDWADSLCRHALTEARGGNTSIVNRLGANTAMKIYFDNVHGLGSVKAHDFPFQYASRFKEISGLYEDYQRELATVEAVDKVATLESKLDTLQAMVQQLVEAQKPVEAVVVEPVVTEEVEAPKKGKKAAKTEVVETEVVAEEVEAETPAEADESEA